MPCVWWDCSNLAALIQKRQLIDFLVISFWERLDQKLQWVLEGGPAYWQEPPNPQRLRLFVRSLDELRSQVELEGLTPH